MLIEIKYPLELKFIRQICQTTSEIAKIGLNQFIEHKGHTKFLQEIELMTGEACTNSIRHASNPNSGVLILRLILTQNHFEVVVLDQNPKFEFNDIGLPLFNKIPESGYGIHIIKSLADKVIYTRTGNWNRLHIIKRFSHFL